MAAIKRTAKLVIAACALFAQQPQPAFDVVSVKQVPIPPGQLAINPTCTSGNYHAPVRGVAASIRFAYNLQTYQLTGMPAWASKSDAAFDIEGKSAAAVSEADCRLMVQSLLADRFKLAIHHESKTFPAVMLVASRNGAKVKPWTNADQGIAVQVNGVAGAGGEKGWTMAQFAEYAARFFPGSVAIDRTGLEGAFRIKLNFDVRPPAQPADEFQSAVESQLGLKFESRKLPVDVVVVDHVERPSAN